MLVPRVLAVETDEEVLALLADLCARWEVELDVLPDAESSLKRLAEQDYGLVFSAVDLSGRASGRDQPGMSGLELVRQIKRRHADLPVILLADEPRVTDAVEAIKSGAGDYLDKPLSREALELSVAGLVLPPGLVPREVEPGTERGEPGVAGELTAPKNAGAPKHLRGGQFLTENRLMRRAVNYALSLADIQAPVLLEGETGVGKNLLAREIHRHSRRRGPFVQVTCTALAEYLLASELFGHVRGAFSGADRDRRGKLEAANGGVLFVDGIAEASLALQRRLLRVIEDRVIERVGEGHPTPVDVKVVVATNCELAELVWNGKFCEPLHHRLNVATVKVPPLRHRKDDIPILARRFLKRFRERHGRGPKDLSDGGIDALEEYSWPGNVGELESVIQTAASLCPAEAVVLGRDHLPGMLAGKPVSIRKPPVEGIAHSTSLGYLLGQRERTFVEQALVATDYNIQHSAKLLQISRPTLYAKMKRFGLHREDGRGGGGDR